VVTALDWHAAVCAGRWDFERLLRDYRKYTRHSRQIAAARSKVFTWSDVVFVLNENAFIAVSASFGGEREVTVWAKSISLAEVQMRTLKARYLRGAENNSDADHFFMLMVVPFGGVTARRVSVPSLHFTPGDLSLHYGEQFCCWNDAFLKKIRAPRLGLTIFQGPPGTGKTSYLRHLLHTLRETHRIYYVPVTVYSVLAAPTTVDFWISENARHADKLKIVLIEDAETLLMQRGSDNHDALSNLLNLADGFLGACLKLHVVCTINAPIDKLDPAMLRPGRLLARYSFERLSPEHARRLSTAKGLPIRLQKSYSLAEIYHPADVSEDGDKRRAGFQCAQ
jgi:hypothetical protein